jgi:HEAT repeat protein
MIDSYSLGMNNTRDEKLHVSFAKWLESWWPKRPMIQLASTMALLIIGLITGFSIGSRTESKNEIVRLKTDVNQLQQVVMTSILDQASVTERIRGLTMTSQLKNTDKEFYSTLLLILNSDSNVNVRMAAVNALANFTGNEYVRRELVKSLSLQSSPLIQVSLIDLLTTIREPEASSALINIINDDDANIHVKERAKKALKQFI